MNHNKECPQCLGAKIIMTPKPTTGFVYKDCSLCKATGEVSEELADDYELSLNEDNLDFEEE